MGRILLIAIICVTAIYTLFKPWIGICAYYLLAILGPQYIWFWNFEGLRASLIVAVFTILGVLLTTPLKALLSIFMASDMNRWVSLLLLFLVSSYYFGPYVSSFNVKSGLSPDFVLRTSVNIILFYFISTLTITDTPRIKYLTYVIVIATIYLIYWANYQYFTSNWSHFYMGRLKGPEGVNGGSIYADQNDFAMLFVTGLPFLYFFVLQYRGKLVILSSIVVLALGWHAVFLTGSRGGLLGLISTVLVVTFLHKKKSIALLVVLIFGAFFIWQAGSTMKSRSESISEYKKDNSAEARLIAWSGGVRMIAAHPVTGVGLGSFITALPSFIESSPRVAHNTLLQFTAESGVGAGICYVMIIIVFVKNFKKVRRWCSRYSEIPGVAHVLSINNASFTSFVGLLVCSIFLSLNLYEIYFYLLALNNSLSLLCDRGQEGVSNLRGEVLTQQYSQAS